MFGLDIHVDYLRKGGGMDCTRFSAPATASNALRPPRTVVHVGFCADGADGNHYVSLPALLQR